jgi:hypothetical protein
MKMFHEVDADGSGTLTIGEMKAAAPKVSLSVAKAVGWLAELDTDGSGVIGAPEFAAKYTDTSAFQRLVGAVHITVDSAKDFAATLRDVESRPLKTTFSSAEELGRGALAGAFKGKQISALAFRLLRG